MLNAKSDYNFSFSVSVPCVYDSINVGTVAKLFKHLELTHNTAVNRIIRILNYMEENVTTEMSLSDLSARAGMSESSFRHRFRELTGLPPLDYLIRLRLRRAILQLQYGDRSITQIALESGFSDGNYFARKFRQFFNCTAREFRQACRAGEIELHEYLEKLNLHQIN